MTTATVYPDLQQLAALAGRVEQGQPVDPARVVALTKSSDRRARGLAKRLLAHVRVQQVDREVADLLAEACADLDYTQLPLLMEAVQHVGTLGQHDRKYELWLGAAEATAKRGDDLRAVTYLLNAGSHDFRHGARHINEPEFIRRTVAVYERAAGHSRPLLGVAPAPRGLRRSPPDQPLRMAHVTAQLVDGGHSPSRVIKTLLTHADRRRFQHYLVVTEALAEHTEHTEQEISSDWSDRRAPELIRYIEQDLRIPVVRPRTRRSLLAAAADLHAQMAALQIDVAFYHGSIITPTDWLLCAWQAAPWQLDHGFGAPLHCPAVDFQFFEFESTRETLAFLCRERNIPYGTCPYSGSDMSHLEGLAPLAREQLGIPPAHVILGSVGNHLPSRMSPEFCRVIAAVMRAHPQTTYLVVGPGDFRRQTEIFGPELCGPSARVRFLGPSDQCGRLTKSFDIYVNEYPAGGGIAVLEAMASAKPVVGMQVGASGLAAVVRLYVGDEFLVQPASDEAYAARLARLIAAPDERRTLGRALRQRYEEYFDGRKWMEFISNQAWEVVRQSLRGAG